MATVKWHAAHFNKVAKVIRERRDPDHELAITDEAWRARELLLDTMTLVWAEYFIEQNPAFNESLFIRRCGFKEET